MNDEKNKPTRSIACDSIADVHEAYNSEPNLRGKAIARKLVEHFKTDYRLNPLVQSLGYLQPKPVAVIYLYEKMRQGAGTKFFHRFEIGVVCLEGYLSEDEICLPADQIVTPSDIRREKKRIRDGWQGEPNSETTNPSIREYNARLVSE